MEDDDIILMAGIAAYLKILQKNKKQRRPRKVWVNPYLQQRFTKGRFALAVRVEVYKLILNMKQ